MIAPVLAEKRGYVGRLVLRAPATLNALTLEMVEILLRSLEEFARDPGVRIVLLEGEGEKAFCAGGDVRKVTLSRPGDPSYAERFFASEYRLDHAIHRFSKPVVVMGHGIVMGGGLGLFAGGSHRIVTETTTIAMPELAIGFFPDVGGSYFLNRLPGGLGLFLALSGTRIGAGDALRSGLANGAVASDEREAALNALLAREWPSDRAEAIRELDAFFGASTARARAARAPAFRSEIEPREGQIAGIVAGASLEEIAREFRAVASSEDAWLARAANGFLAGSPTSAAVTFEQLRRSRDFALEDCFRMELVLAVRCCQGHDFPEGVRARLVDKDQRPRWDPASLEGVTPAWVAHHFDPPWSADRHPLRDLPVS